MNARTGLLTVGLLAGLSTLAVSCGGGSSKPLTEDDYCTQRAGKECEVADTCQFSVETCKTARKLLCTMQVTAIKSTPNTPRVFHPENVPACISKAADVYKLTTIKPSDMADLADVCNYVFQGNVVKLAACMVKYDCKDRGATICDKGFCADKLVKGTGIQCPEFGAVCMPPEYCTTVGAATKCVPKKGSGEPCDATTPCLDTLRCAGGACAPLLKLNDKCTSDDDCSTDAPYCNPYAGNECGKGLTFATHSPSCSAFGDTEAAAPTGAAGSGGTPGGDGAAGSGGGGGAGGDGAAGATGAAGSDAAATADGSDGAAD